MSKPCCPILMCGRGPEQKPCPLPPVNVATKTTFYHPCPAYCKCPDSWPTLLPKARCCVRPPRYDDPPATPVIPCCKPLRYPPMKCPKARPLSPERLQTPIIPCCKPCCPPQLKPNPPPPYIRCLNPAIPCCPPCRPQPVFIHPPEPPYPPYCPVLPPCICPERPVMTHNSVRKYRITSDCKMVSCRDNPLVCYLPAPPEQLSQVDYFCGCCYNTTC